MHTGVGIFAALWGSLGVTLLLGFAIFRLTPVALEAFDHHLAWYHTLLLILNIAFMAYSEGYRGFQKAFSPRVAARALYLKSRPSPLQVVLAPLFCIGYFHASRTRMVVSILTTLMILVFIFVVRTTPQPWRGIIDAGVVVGLGWGLVTLFIFLPKALLGKDFEYSPEIPPELQPENQA